MRSPEERFQATVLVPALDKLEKANQLSYFHVPNGGYRRKVEAQIMKAMGVRAGVPDLVILWRRNVGFLEVKRPWKKGERRGYLTESQKNWRDWLQANGHKWALVESLDDMLSALTEWGIIGGKDK